MPFDPQTVLGGAPVQPANPLALATQMMGLQQGINQNKLFQQQTADRAAYDQAVKASTVTDPATGETTVDQNKMLQYFSTNNLGRLAPEFMKNSAELRAKQLEYQRGQLEMGLKRADATLSAVSSVMAMPNPTRSDVWNQVTALHASGLYNSKELVSILQTMPKEEGAPLKAWLQSIAARTEQGMKQLQAMHGENVQTMAGNRVLNQNFPIMGPQTGQAVTAGVAPMGMTPGEANAIVDRKMPDGSIQQVPRFQLPMQGAGAIPGPMTSAATLPDGTPITDTALVGQSPSLMQAKSIEKAAEGFANYEKDLNENVNLGYALAEKFDTMQEYLKTIRTGGLQNVRMEFARVMQGLGASDDVVDKIAGGKLGDTQAYEKLAITTALDTLTSALQGAGGSRVSQMEFEAFRKANPNLETDPRGVEKIINFSKRLLEMRRTEQLEMNKFREAKGDKFDPRAWAPEWARITEAKGYGKVNPEFPVTGGAKTQSAALPAGLEKDLQAGLAKAGRGAVAKVQLGDKTVSFTLRNGVVTRVEE